MFETGSSNLFDTPTTTQPASKSIGATSPEFSGRSGGASNTSIPSGMPGNMFDSPKQPEMSSAPQQAFTSNAGMGSPGFGGSQQSAGGNMDSVFADLVHDQDESMTGFADGHDHPSGINATGAAQPPTSDAPASETSAIPTTEADRPVQA